MISLHVKASVCDIAEGGETLVARTWCIGSTDVSASLLPPLPDLQALQRGSSFQVLLQDKTGVCNSNFSRRVQPSYVRTAFVPLPSVAAHPLSPFRRSRSASSQIPSPQVCSDRWCAVAACSARVATIRKTVCRYYCWARQPRGSFCLAKSK
jgi:hypothetical protein